VGQAALLRSVAAESLMSDSLLAGAHVASVEAAGAAPAN